MPCADRNPPQVSAAQGLRGGAQKRPAPCPWGRRTGSCHLLPPRSIACILRTAGPVVKPADGRHASPESVEWRVWCWGTPWGILTCQAHCWAGGDRNVFHVICTKKRPTFLQKGNKESCEIPFLVFFFRLFPSSPTPWAVAFRHRLQSCTETGRSCCRSCQ